MKKSLLWGFVALALIAGLLIGKNLPSSTSAPGGAPSADAKGAPGGKPGKGKGPGGKPVSVGIIIATAVSLTEELSTAATILPDEAVELKTEVAGRITALPIREGSVVKKGDLLLTLANDDLKAQLRKAEASLALAKQKLDRQKNLFAKQMSSTEDVETAEREAAATAADADLAQAQLKKTEIRAPFGGTVGLRTVSEGAYVAAGTKIADLVRSSPLKIEASLPERCAGAVEKGTLVAVTTRASGTIHTATVYAVQPQLDKSTRTLFVRARLPESKDLIPGAFATALFSLTTKENAVLLPAIAIIADASGNRVFKAQGGMAIPISVTTGYRDASRVEILSGVAVGDTIITDGAGLVRPNGPITTGDKKRPER